MFEVEFTIPIDEGGVIEGRAALALPAAPPPDLEWRWELAAREAERAPRAGPARIAEPPERWETAPPEFVGVGVQRSGTTWWHRVVSEHPGVCLVPGLHQKEVHFFDRLQVGGGGDLAERYRLHFPRPPGQIAGEWTPDYMFHPGCLRMLAAAAPDANVLVLLRDPINRFRSGVVREIYLERRLSGRAELPEWVAEDQLARGFYAPQLREVLQEFPRERVLVLQYERCLAEPERELRKTYRFLGLEPEGFEPSKLRRVQRWNPSDLHLPVELHEELAARYAPDVASLAPLVPGLEVELWPSVRSLV